MIEYLICAKFEEYFLFETEQFTTYQLVLNNNYKEELLKIANEFFYYLKEIINKNNLFNYFQKEEVKLYINLLKSAQDGIKEMKKLINFFLKNKVKESFNNEKKANQASNKSENNEKDKSNQIQNLSESVSKPKDDSKRFLKSKTFHDKKTENNENQNESKKEEKIDEEEFNLIKTRVKFNTQYKKNIFNKNIKGRNSNLNFDNNESLNFELLKKNNDFLINNCSQIITKIKIFNANTVAKTPNNIKKNSLLNKLITLLNKKKNQKDKKSLLLKHNNFKYNNLNRHSLNYLAESNINTNFPSINYDPILPLVKTQKDYFDIFDWDDIEICKQLTLVTHFIFERVKPKELINSQWTKVDKKTSAPNVYKLIERFNKISLWACEEILSYDKSSLRKLVLDKFINIAYILYKMNNYNDSFSIVTALNSFYIKELKKSWKRVDVNSSIPKAKELNEIFSHTKNYAKLRENLEACLGKPCIPFLGLFLKDLSYMEESQKYINTKKEENIHLLNLEKIKNVDAILKKFEQYQNAKYEYKPVFKLSFLAEPDPDSENVLIELARKLGNYFNIYLLNCYCSKNDSLYKIKLIG